MADDGFRAARITSVIAATVIALSCGTNYAYSAWAPQYADRLHLTATQSNVIGNAANIGMYASGIPIGFIVDKRGPRWGVLTGAICLALGYFPLWSAYNKGPGQTPFILLCIASLLTGIGSCSAFSGAIKTCAMNWPHHRGTATALPLSGFGLSAFAYTSLSGMLFPDDASHLLLFLAIGTFSMVSVGMLFLRMLPPGPSYSGLPTEDGRPGIARKDSNRLRRAHTRQTRARGAYQDDDVPSSSQDSEESSLLSGPGDVADDDDRASAKSHGLHKPEVTGMALLRSAAFWKLWIMLGLLCGVGLMTINNIGNDAKTLWHHWDETKSKQFIQQRQLIHVGILSICSFLGRLCSGIGSDVLVKSFRSSRFWSIVASALIFTVAQIVALNIENPRYLWLVSSLTGLGYGALFGVYPALVADAFGTAGMGINWGAMTMSPVLSGNIFNLIYGVNLDAHSDHPDGAERICLDGRSCYSQAYIVTLVASVVAIGWSLYCVWIERLERIAREKGAEAHEG